jgi:hypothetical protein
MLDDFGQFIEEKKSTLGAGEMTLQAADFSSDRSQRCIKLSEVSHHEKQVT